MALNTIYQLRLIQEWGSGGKRMENVFFYDHTAGSGEAADLATAFGTAILPAIHELQNEIVKDYSIDVINLGDLSDFASVPTVGQGDYSGDALPPYAAVGYTLKVSTRAVRKGSKRFSGVPESVQVNGQVTNATYATSMEALRILLQTELVDASETWLPVVIKRVKTAVVGTVPLQYTYRLPTTDGELTIGEIVVALTSSILSHQVSREF